MGEEGRGKTTSINSIMIPKHLESGGHGGGNVGGGTCFPRMTRSDFSC